MRGAYNPLFHRAWTLPNRDPTIPPQWGWWTDWQSTNTVTWRAIHDTIFNIALCKIYYCRHSVNCGVHQVRLQKLGWDTVSLNRPRALCIHSSSMVLHIARRVKVARYGSQLRGTHLESRWIVRYWYWMQETLLQLILGLSITRAEW